VWFPATLLHHAIASGVSPDASALFRRSLFANIFFSLDRARPPNERSDAGGPQPLGCINVQATPAGKSLLVFENKEADIPGEVVNAHPASGKSPTS